MTAFTKENLITEGKYLTYMPQGYNTPYEDRKFVARFRVAGVGSFATCLRKKFTVEEYFGRMEAGESPLPIAESKGYILPHIKRWIKEAGYPVTRAGHDAWWAAETVKIEAKSLEISKALATHYPEAV